MGIYKPFMKYINKYDIFIQEQLSFFFKNYYDNNIDKLIDNLNNIEKNIDSKKLFNIKKDDNLFIITKDIITLYYICLISIKNTNNIEKINKIIFESKKFDNIKLSEI